MTGWRSSRRRNETQKKPPMEMAHHDGKKQNPERLIERESVLDGFAFSFSAFMDYIRGTHESNRDVKMTPDFIITVDTQFPYFKDGIRIDGERHPIGFQIETLATGNYFIVGHEDQIAVERKIIPIESVTTDRLHIGRAIEALIGKARFMTSTDEQREERSGKVHGKNIADRGHNKSYGREA